MCQRRRDVGRSLPIEAWFGMPKFRTTLSRHTSSEKIISCNTLQSMDSYMYKALENFSVTVQPDLIVRDAYLQDRDSIRDVSVADGMITSIEESTDTTADVEIDAEGNLVSPGFVDAHVHMDQGLSVGDQRLLDHNDEPFEKQWSMDMSAEYFEHATANAIEETVVEVAKMAVANGITHVRTHAYIDATVGSKSVAAVQAARERMSDYLDIQIVAFPQQGLLAEPGAGPELLRESIEAGADLVGGLDPATVNRNISKSLETAFSVAKEKDVGIDLHLHDTGSVGAYTIERLGELTCEHDHEGRVTASHCFSIADVAGRSNAQQLPVSSLADLLARLADADMSVTTSYLSTPSEMPVRELQEAGIALGQGSDQIHDFWAPHGNFNPVEQALIQSLRLGPEREYSTNSGLDRIWTMLTTGGASVLGVEGHSIDVGTPADLVVHSNRSRQRVIIEQSQPRLVVKNGAVVARDGTVVDS